MCDWSASIIQVHVRTRLAHDISSYRHVAPVSSFVASPAVVCETLPAWWSEPTPPRPSWGSPVLCHNVPVCQYVSWVMNHESKRSAKHRLGGAAKKLTAPNEIWQLSLTTSPISGQARAEGIKHFLSNHCVWSRAFPVHLHIVPFCCSFSWSRSSSPPHLPLPVASPTSVWPPIPGLCRGDLRAGWVRPVLVRLFHSTKFCLVQWHYTQNFDIDHLIHTTSYIP